MSKTKFSAAQFNNNGVGKLSDEEVCSIDVSTIFQWIKQGKVNCKGFTKYVKAYANVNQKEYSVGYADGFLDGFDWFPKD